MPPPATLVRSPVGIIGAGISGAATAYSLASRGIPVVVYERNHKPALEASGNYQGILYGSWSAFGGNAMELSSNAYDYTRNLITTLLQEGLDYSACGIIQLGFNAHQAKRNQQLLLLDHLDKLYCKVNTDELETISGTKINAKGGPHLYFPDGLWLHPTNFVTKLLDHPLIELRCNTNIRALTYVASEWQLSTANEEESYSSLPRGTLDPQYPHLASHAQLVLCNAHAVEQLAPW